MPATAPWLRGTERAFKAFRMAAGLGGLALVAFHGWLLASQIAAGRFTEPALVLRWLIAAALVAGLVALRRSGASVWGRKGITVWLLAAMLHGPAVAASADQSRVLALPEAIAAIVVQITTAAGSLALGLWILSRILGANERRHVPRLVPFASVIRRGPDPNRRPSAPRPPPRI